MRKTVVTIAGVKVFEDRLGCWYATSDDISGLNLCGRDRSAVERDIPRLIRILYKENFGLDIDVKTYVDPSEFPHFSETRDDRYALEAEPLAAHA